MSSLLFFGKLKCEQWASILFLGELFLAGEIYFLSWARFMSTWEADIFLFGFCDNLKRCEWARFSFFLIFWQIKMWVMSADKYFDQTKISWWARIFLFWQKSDHLKCCRWAHFSFLDTLKAEVEDNFELFLFLK